MASFSKSFTPFAEKMAINGLPHPLIKSFYHYYKQLENGETGYIPESCITPVSSLPDSDTFSSNLIEIGKQFLNKTVTIKLNGGLGTSMGLNKAKSLIPIKDSLTFLDITARQAMQIGSQLVLMNSFATHDDTMASLEIIYKYKNIKPLVFKQHRVPKVNESDLTPVDWPKDRELEWCPPGHGDIYLSLYTTHMLDYLLNSGYKYAFISNIDNLGAFLDPKILGHFIKNDFSFMLEVADRTPMDQKGGHLAWLKGNRLILRELSQCSPNDLIAFQDTTRHKYFNTNNLWINLQTLSDFFVGNDGVLLLPIIRNLKNIDSKDKSSPIVYQIETAMGAGIDLFDNSSAVRVPRSRFAPVKTNNDLITIRSDLYTLNKDFCIVPNTSRNYDHFSISLDKKYYAFLDDFESRFPNGIPSLINCESLAIQGDFQFGGNIIFKGAIQLVNQSKNQIIIPDNLVIDSSKHFTKRVKWDRSTTTD